MPRIDNSVSQLNAVVYSALQEVKDPGQITEAEAQKIRTAILLDGEIDTNERDLMNELTQGKGNVRVSNGEAPAASLNVSAAQGKAKSTLEISMWAVWERKLEIKVEDAADGIQNFKDWASSHIYQYDPTQGTKQEGQANCGPASAAMMCERLGIKSPQLHDLRKMVGARLGVGEGAFALSKNQVGDAVVKQGARQGIKVSYEVVDMSKESKNIDSMLNALRKRLDAGEKIILLTSNIQIPEKDKYTRKGQGHYVVLEAIKPDGTIIVDDPQKPANVGQDREHSKQAFALALWRRSNVFKLDNSIIAFKNN